MKTKKFSHKEIEDCKMSKKSVNCESDKYCVVLDCDGDKITNIGFYKLEEFKGFIKGNIDKVSNEIMKRTQNLAGNMTQGMLKKFGLAENNHSPKNRT